MAEAEKYDPGESNQKKKHKMIDVYTNPFG